MGKWGRMFSHSFGKVALLGMSILTTAMRRTATPTIMNGLIIPAIGVNWVGSSPAPTIVVDGEGVVSVSVALDFICLWNYGVSSLEGDSFVADNRRSLLSDNDSIVVLSVDDVLVLSPPAMELCILSVFSSVIASCFTHISLVALSPLSMVRYLNVKMNRTHHPFVIYTLSRLCVCLSRYVHSILYGGVATRLQSHQ